MKIRKNDTVLVIAGKDKGKKGKVRFPWINPISPYTASRNGAITEEARFKKRPFG